MIYSLGIITNKIISLQIRLAPVISPILISDSTLPQDAGMAFITFDNVDKEKCVFDTLFMKITSFLLLRQTRRNIFLIGSIIIPK